MNPRLPRLSQMGFLVGTVLLLASPAGTATLFGLVNTGELFSSADNGVTWNVHATLPVSDAVAITAGSTSSELYLASRTGTVYRSEDGGSSWDAVGTVSASDVTDLVVRPDGAVMLLTESGTVYISMDQGETYTAQAALTGSNFVGLTRSTPFTLYALTETGEVVQTTNGGVEWATVGVMAVSDAANIRVLNSSLYVLTGTGDVYRSEDNGASWTPIGTLSQAHMAGFTSDGTQLFAATREGEVASSADGVSWGWQGTINQLSVMALGTDTPSVGAVGGRPFRPRIFTLHQNYPNPFKPGIVPTQIPFDLMQTGRVELRIYDARGRLVRALFEGELAAESHRIPWRGLDNEGCIVAPGVYSYELRSGDSVSSRRAIVVR